MSDTPVNTVSNNDDQADSARSLRLKRLVEEVYEPIKQELESLIPIAVPSPGKHVFAYRLPGGQRIEREDLELLADAGYMVRRFYDRTYVCRQCGSSAIIFREVCEECMSPNLERPELIHHFLCAGVFRASEYGDPDDLHCPKCRRRLTHVGVDHEYVRGEFECKRCRHVSAWAPAGGRCLQCGSQFQAEQARLEEWYIYVPHEKAAVFDAAAES